MNEEHLTLIGTLTQSAGNGIPSEQGVAVFKDISITLRERCISGNHEPAMTIPHPLMNIYEVRCHKCGITGEAHGAQLHGFELANTVNGPLVCQYCRCLYMPR